MGKKKATKLKVSALFAGIAGIELGLHQSQHETLMFSEIDEGARAVLRDHFPDIDLVPDVRDIITLPKGTNLVTAGFPCQDLSQAGMTNGINGRKSRIVEHLFKLLERDHVENVLIENVPFMLQLDHGQAIRYLVSKLESLGYSWAYRVVDAQCFGIPQRRERVFLLASKRKQPSSVLFEGNHPKPLRSYHTGIACGFYWTEGLRGLGWAVDSVPTIKGGSTIGIPSPPAIWMPDGRIVKPSICDAERLQGFPEDWTLPAERIMKKGYRWKLVGNAVSVAAATWLGKCLSKLGGDQDLKVIPYEFKQDKAWPTAAYGFPDGSRYAVEISTWPMYVESPPLVEFLKHPPDNLSRKATAGFVSRLKSGTLRYPREFLDALEKHLSSFEFKEASSNGGR